MALSSRLLTGISRAADGLAIIANSTGITVGEHSRKRPQYDYLKQQIGRERYAAYKEDLPALSVMYDDNIQAFGGRRCASADVVWLNSRKSLNQRLVEGRRIHT